MATVVPRPASGGIGESVLRKEDAAFISGQGRYVDDLVLPGMLHAVFVRSPFGHATISGIDTADAEAMPWRREDHHGRDARPRRRRAVRLEPDRHDPAAPPPAAGRGPRPVPRRARGHGDRIRPLHRPRRRRRRTRRLRPAAGRRPTAARRSPTARRGCTTSTTTTAAARWRTRPRASPRRSPPAPASSSAHNFNQRITPMSMETRGCVADWVTSTGEVTLFTSTQVPHFVRTFVGSHQRDVRVEGARGRPRRRRRVRLEAELLPRGVPPLRRLQGRRRAGEVDRGPQREHPRHHPRPRPVAVVRGRASTRRARSAR